MAIRYEISHWLSEPSEKAFAYREVSRRDTALQCFLDMVWEALDHYGARDTEKAHQIMNTAKDFADSNDYPLRRGTYIEYKLECMGGHVVRYSAHRI